MSDDARDNKPRCESCGRLRNEVKHNMLVPIKKKNEPPYICVRCVSDLSRFFDEHLQHEASEAAKDEALKKPYEIKAHLDQYVIGMEKAKLDVSLAVYNHFKRRQAMKRGKVSVEVGGQDEEVEMEKSNILLLGPSGTGKTHIARAIAKMLKVPFYVADCTRLTKAGYVGDDVETILQGLIADADGDIERAQWGIALLDEVDKICRGGSRGLTGLRDDVGGEGVQQALLKLIEGSRVPVPRGMGMKAVGVGQADMIDTTNILFICAGSFAGIEACVGKRLNQGGHLGFGAAERKKFDDKDKTSVYLQVKEEDVLDFGMIPEMLGRLPVLTTTIDLTEDEMIDVLTKPKNALLKQFRASFKMDGIDLQVDEEAQRAIAKDAKTRPTGARALRSIMEAVLRPYAFDAPQDPTIAAIRITAGVVEGKEKAMIITRDKVAAAG